MKLVTLGTPRLDRPDATATTARKKQVALLSYLARQENREATRAQLADLLWEEGDRAKARHSLRQALSGLRPILGDLLVTDGEHVRLSGQLPLDLADLEARDGRDAAPGAASTEAEFLPGFEDVGGERWRSWLRSERDAVRRRFRWRSGPVSNRARRVAARERQEPGDPLAEAWENLPEGAALLVDAAPDGERAAMCERFASSRAAEGQLLAADAGTALARPYAYLGRLCARLPEFDGLDGAPPSALAALRRFAPGLASRFPRLPLRSTQGHDPAAALAEALAASASHGPVAVLAADFERADAASRAVLGQLVRERPARVSVILVGRLDDGEASAELRSLMRLPGVVAVHRPGDAIPTISPPEPPPLPPAATLASRFTSADHLLLAVGGAVALVVLVLAILASV